MAQVTRAPHPILRLVTALASGGLFGAGLVVSGMTDTTKVQGWLDLFGAWDPTLAFVLGFAVLPMALVWWWVEGRAGARQAAPRTALLGTPLPNRPAPTIDRPLILGSLLFGAGWAIIGLCPGPALASIGYGGWQGAVFLAAMIAGMLLHPLAARALTPAR